MMVDILRVAAMALSFFGLCSLVQKKLDVSFSAAPLAAACMIINLMMVAGIAGALKWAWIILYVVGFIGLGWHIIARRHVEWVPVGILALALVYAAWHFRNAYFTGNDSVSHWGLVAKYLLRTDRFPDGSSELIYFQSYPVGSAAFIYYLLRGIGTGEGRYLSAQFMLYVMALLPLLGFIRNNRALGCPFFALIVVYLLTFTGLTSLQVDGLLAYLCVGGTSLAAQHGAEPRKAAAVVLPVAVALVFIKASGLFFSMLLVCMVYLSARKSGKDDGERPARLLMIMILLCLAAFALWQVHVKVAFRNVDQSKHALSASNYINTFKEKPWTLIRRIAAGMLKWLVHPGRMRGMACAVILCMYGALLGMIGARKQDRSVWLPRLKTLAVWSAAVFLIWYGLLFAMYVFSMPVEEARRLASLSRYVNTALILVIGWAGAFVLAWLCRKEYSIPRRALLAGAACLLGVPVLFFTASAQGRKMARSYVHRAESHPEPFGAILSMLERGEVEEGRSYFVFGRDDEMPLSTLLYTIKYECFSNDIMLLIGGIEREGYDSQAYYSFRNTYIHDTDCERVDNLDAVLQTYAGAYDYMLVCAKDPVFEASLKTHSQGLSIHRAY